MSIQPTLPLLGCLGNISSKFKNFLRCRGPLVELTRNDSVARLHLLSSVMHIPDQMIQSVAEILKWVPVEDEVGLYIVYRVSQ